LVFPLLVPSTLQIPGGFQHLQFCDKWLLFNRQNCDDVLCNPKLACALVLYQEFTKKNNKKAIDREGGSTPEASQGAAQSKCTLQNYETRAMPPPHPPRMLRMNLNRIELSIDATRIISGMVTGH
jgi:hypothetical protein